MKVGVVGTGYWGPNLIRNFLSFDEVEAVVACDIEFERLERIRKSFHAIETTTDLDSMLKRPDIDAIVIATPVSTHFEIARKALGEGKHCWIEKPMTMGSADASKLIEIAREKGLILFVDHTFIYTGAVRKIKELVTSGRLGEIYYFDSVRINLGLFQHDVDVLWDLAPHDLSIMEYILDEKPIAVSATGSCHIKDGLADVAYLTLFFRNELIAHFHVNWLAPVKVRKTMIGGTKSMIVYDDNEPLEKVKIYDKGVEVATREGIYDILVQYRTGDMISPKVDGTEALKLAGQHFIDCILRNEEPITGGREGLRVVRILEAAKASMLKNGEPVELKDYE